MRTAKKIKQLIKTKIYENFGITISRSYPNDHRPDHVYEGDAMIVRGRNLRWLNERRFQRAYQRGYTSGHQWDASSANPAKLEWRVHVALWAASHALHLPGDFVECGVNTGILSLAICDYLDFGTLNRKMYLFDTFKGIPEDLMSESEKEIRTKENQRYYPDCYDRTMENFSTYRNVQLVRGIVPQSLSDVDIDKVAYLSIDMNIAAPERAAIEHFWPRLSSGAIVVLDDYGWKGYEEQSITMDEFAATKGVTIACLPTGQGILIKP